MFLGKLKWPAGEWRLVGDVFLGDFLEALLSKPALKKGRF